MFIKRFLKNLLLGSGAFYELARGIVLAMIVGVLIHFYLFSAYPVLGDSMLDTLSPGDVVLVNKLQKHKDLERGQVVIVRFPGDVKGKLYVKRIVALPGETIEIKDKTVLIDGEELKEEYLSAETLRSEVVPDIPPTSLSVDNYYILGDHRVNSIDSRSFGAISKSDIIAKGQYIVWPFFSSELLQTPNY